MIPSTEKTKSRALALPTLFITCVYVTFLAGDTVLAGISVRLFGLLCCVVGALLMQYAPVVHPGFSGRGGGIVVWIISWLVLVGASSVWAPLGARVGTYLEDLVYLGLLVAILGLTISRLPDHTLCYVWVVLWVSGVVFAVTALLGIGALEGQDRLSALGSGPNVFVRVVGLGAIASIALVKINPSRYWVTMLSLPLLLQAAILSGSRGGVLALAVSGGLLIVLGLMGTSVQTKGRTIIGLVLLALLGYLWIWPHVRTFVHSRYVETVAEGYSSGRDVILDHSVSLFRENGFLGVGLDGYWGGVGYRTGHQHPHNLVLQTFLESGIFAGVALAVAMIVGFRAAVTWLQPTASLFGCAALLIGVAAMFSGTWYDSRFLWFFLLLGAESVRRSLAAHCPNGRRPQDFECEGRRGSREGSTCQADRTETMRWSRW